MAVREGVGPGIFALVMHDLSVRDSVGMEEYGVPLRAFNGRDPLWDAYEEALDLAVYLRQAVEEARLAPKSVIVYRRVRDGDS